MRIYEDLRVVQRRLVVLQYVVVILIGLLLVHYWNLQVLKGRYYRAEAENNLTREVPIAAPRGPLLDRAGRILVENRPSFNVLMTPEHSDDVDRAIARLARILRMGEAQIRERLARRAQLFHPVVVKADATLEDIAAIEARRLEVPEAWVEVVPLRHYPLTEAAAHTLGHVGEVTERQLKSPDFANLQPGTRVGQVGIESQYNPRLMGEDGYRRVIVNSRGREVGEAKRERPKDGPSLTLTLDSDLQRAMEQALKTRSGAAVALDPETGDVLAMTSTPAYDPNPFTTGIEASAWSRLVSDDSTPMINRVIQGQYAPGSVFKIVIAAAALEEGVITPSTTFYCPGYLSVYDTVFRCGRASGHGVVSVHRAIAQSCNVFFYQVGIRLEIDRIARYAKRLGLGAPTGIDLPHEASGLIPSPEWKLKAQKAPWYGGETVSVAIGQGQVTVTPLQMARLAALVANGGRLVQPHLVKAVGSEPLHWDPPLSLGLRPETVQVLREGMRAVVNEQGSGARARLTEVEVSGKTGSAQVVGHARVARAGAGEATLAHGWFIAFAPYDRPQIALAVIVEHGRSGSEAAVPVAREILARYFRTETPTVAADSGPP